MARAKKKNDIPKDIRAMVEGRSDGACEMLRHPGCIGQAQQMHHRKLRSQGGAHDVVNLIHICEPCHRYAHGNPKVAQGEGWIVKSVHDPSETPVTYRGQPVMLTEDGHIQNYFKPRESTGLSS